jgi:hypothetical protein
MTERSCGRPAAERLLWSRAFLFLSLYWKGPGSGRTKPRQGKYPNKIHDNGDQMPVTKARKALGVGLLGSSMGYGAPNFRSRYDWCDSRGDRRWVAFLNGNL